MRRMFGLLATRWSVYSSFEIEMVLTVNFRTWKRTKIDAIFTRKVCNVQDDSWAFSFNGKSISEWRFLTSFFWFFFFSYPMNVDFLKSLNMVLHAWSVVGSVVSGFSVPSTRRVTINLIPIKKMFLQRPPSRAIIVLSLSLSLLMKYKKWNKFSIWAYHPWTERCIISLSYCNIRVTFRTIRACITVVRFISFAVLDGED